ncbi:TPA: nuclear transport factor 2 family protein [Yersinia enterocolitica]
MNINHNARRISRTLSVVAILMVSVMANAAMAQSTLEVTASNKQKVESALTAWSNGTGGILDLLSENIRWTIVGNSLESGTTVGKAQLNQKVNGPFGARFTKSQDKFRPVVIKGVYGDGDTVIAYFEGRGTANDGKPYVNTYAWILKMQDGKVIEGTAFFDSVAFNDLWTRVKP